MKNLCRCLIPAVIISLLAAGCFNNSTNVKVNWDSSVDYSVTMTYDSNNAEMAQSMSGQMESIKQYLASFGVNAEDVDMGEGIKGIRASYKLASIDMLEDSHTIWKMNGQAEIFGKIPEETMQVVTHNYAFVKKVDVSGNIFLPQSQAQENQPKILFSFTVPMATKNHNATTVENGGKTLTWDISLVNPNPVQLSFYIVNMQTVIMLAAILALIIIIIVILILAARKPTSPIVEDDEEIDEKYLEGEYDLEAEEDEDFGEESPIDEIIEEHEFDNEADEDEDNEAASGNGGEEQEEQ